MKKMLFVVMLMVGSLACSKGENISKNENDKLNNNIEKKSENQQSATKKYIDTILNKEFTLDNSMLTFTKENEKYIANWLDEEVEEDGKVTYDNKTKDILEYDSKEDMLYKDNTGFKFQENKLALYILNENNKFEFQYYLTD